MAFRVMPMPMVMMRTERVPLPKEVMDKLNEWETNSKSVSVMITGKTGSGKSTLVNTLVGQEVAEEGRSLERCSTEVKSHSKTVDGIALTVWDSPGLQDEFGVADESKYLQEIKRNCDDVDLFVYCIRMSEANYSSDIEAMRKLTKTLGQELWSNAIIVLTFANDMSEEATTKHRNDKKKVQKAFMKSLKKWRKKITTKLEEEVGLEEELAKKVDILPAGYRTDPKLPIEKSPFWMTTLWLRALRATKSRAQPAMIKINRHRFKTLSDEGSAEAKDEAAQKELQAGQDLVFESKGLEFGEEAGVDPRLAKICGDCKSKGEDEGTALMIQLSVVNNMLPLPLLRLMMEMGGIDSDPEDDDAPKKDRKG